MVFGKRQEYKNKYPDEEQRQQNQDIIFIGLDEDDKLTIINITGK